MNLHEYQSKELLKSNGIKVPKSKIASTINEAFEVAKDFNSNLAVKAQIHAGGRGKAGGVKIITSPQEAKEFASLILGKNLITCFYNRISCKFWWNINYCCVCRCFINCFFYSIKYR